MTYSYKKVLPEDVFVSMYSEEVNEQDEHLYIKRADDFSIKLSGVEFMDVFAQIMWRRPYADIEYYATKFGASVRDFSSTVLLLSGLTATEWRNKYVMLAAYDLLKHSELSISGISARLGFGKVRIFSLYFFKHDGKRPLTWRYNVRGFNANKDDILRMRMLDAGLSCKVNKK